MRTLLLWLAFTTTAHGQASYLGLCHKDWNCSATLQTWGGLPQIETGWLENTFGKDCPCGEQILAAKKPKTIRVHLINSPCMRNGRCGRYEALYGYDKTSASRAVMVEGSRLNKRFNAILERFKRRLEGARGEVACYVSPCLECDLNERARKSLFDRVSVALPRCVVVDNPQRQRCLKGAVCEGHGESPAKARACIVDMDGTDAKTLDVAKWIGKYRNCVISYYWEPWMNCMRGKFLDPRKRNCWYPSSVFKETKEALCQYFYPLSATCSP